MFEQFFTEDHQIYRKSVREWLDREIAPKIDEFESTELTPRWVFKRAGELGFLGAHFPEAHGGSGCDAWYTVVWTEELAKTGVAGTSMGLMVQSDMATPVISALGDDYHIEEFLKPALRGDKVAALGITEPGAGSDVACLRTTAVRDGDDYIVWCPVVGASSHKATSPKAYSGPVPLSGVTL